MLVVNNFLFFPGGKKMEEREGHDNLPGSPSCYDLPELIIIEFAMSNSWTGKWLKMMYKSRGPGPPVTRVTQYVTWWRVIGLLVLSILSTVSSEPNKYCKWI